MLYKDTDKDTIVQLVLNRDGFESTCSFLRKDCQDTLLRISHGHSDGVSSTVCKFSLDKGHRGVVRIFWYDCAALTNSV